MAVEDGEMWTVGGTVQGVRAVTPEPGKVASAAQSTDGMPKMRFECRVTAEDSSLARYDFSR